MTQAAVCPSDARFSPSRSTGKERDSESGNDYFGARYYASSMGRMMSPDPLIFNQLRIVNPQRWNMYAYAINNPLTFTDPDGRDAIHVTFTSKIGDLGHDGVVSVHSDGSVRFAEFGPEGDPKPFGRGEVQTASSSKSELNKLDMANGVPTQESIEKLKRDLADIEGVKVDSIKMSYFKASDMETAAMDAFIDERLKSPGWYSFIGRSCRDFSEDALRQANTKASGHSIFSLIPNIFKDYWPDNTSMPKGKGTVKVLPGFTPVEN